MRSAKRSISVSGVREMADERDVAMRQVHVDAVVWSAMKEEPAVRLPSPAEHEVLHQQLVVAREDRRAAFALGRVVDVAFRRAPDHSARALAG